MKKMSEIDLALYRILKNNADARKNTYTACRMLYKEFYNIDLPDLTGLQTLTTTDRKIRLFKELYSECNDDEAKQIMADKQDDFKEMVLDRNKPYRPIEEKYEQQKIGWW